MNSQGTTSNTARQLGRWADKAREATRRRDALIAELRDEGASLREIGAAAGLSHVAVLKILQRTA